jgi:hypothetical protein
MAATATATAATDDAAPALPDRTTPFRKKDRVVAAVDLPGIPAGTTGKVTFVAGFDWIRYWVRWDNGVTRGSINRKHLVRPGEPYGAELAELEAAAAAAGTAAPGDADAGGDAGGGGGAEGVTVAGVHIPAHLLERSKKRRELLGA